MSKIIITIEIPDGATVGVANADVERRHEQRLARESDYDGAPPPESPSADPWGDSDTNTSGRQENRPEGRPEPSRGNSGRSASGVVKDDKGRQWTFGAPGAPQCQCGEPAAQVKGFTNGKPWTQWRCAKSYDDWRNKCDFSQFAGGRK